MFFCFSLAWLAILNMAKMRKCQGYFHFSNNVDVYFNKYKIVGMHVFEPNNFTLSDVHKDQCSQCGCSICKEWCEKNSAAHQQDVSEVANTLMELYLDYYLL